MRKHKLIGVTPRLLTVNSTVKEFVNRNYIDILSSYDCNVVMLTIGNPKQEEVLELCDGFLITGGDDIDPSFFGEINTGQSRNIDREADEIDRMVVEHAAKTKKPVLGICRGNQAINVFMGGNLYQDIGDKHANVPSDHHGYGIKNDILDFGPKINVNSYHHQAVNRVAPGMKAVAFADDGTVEAIVHEKLPIIGIQWHPERLPNEAETKIIFEKFLAFLKKSVQ